MAGKFCDTLLNLLDVVLTFASVASVASEVKVIEQYLSVVLFVMLYNVVLTLESENKNCIVRQFS